MLVARVDESAHRNKRLEYCRDVESVTVHRDFSCCGRLGSDAGVHLNLARRIYDDSGYGGGGPQRRPGASVYPEISDDTLDAHFYLQVSARCNNFNKL